MKAYLSVLSLLLLSLHGFGRQTDTLRLSLDEVVQMAKEKSISAKQAVSTRETKYWEWRTFKSNYQPQLTLSGVVPGYSKTFREVLQPNGTIDFQPVRNNNSSVSLAFSQSITMTGGSVFGTTQLQRFDDFDRNNVLYNGVPYAIGYSQPLFQYNQLRWDQRVEPLKYSESRQAYIESMEKIAVQANEYFFDLLLAQANLQISESNFSNTDTILKVAQLKYDLGKITKNEILQLQLERLKAQKSVGVAKRDMEIAMLNLRSYTGLGSVPLVLQAPLQSPGVEIAAEKALSEAFANRADAIGFARRLAEAKRAVAKAKGESGINAALTARLGFSKSASKLRGVYRSPQDQQLLQVELSIPILDWGRSQSRTRTARVNLQLEEYSVEQDKQNFSQEIITQVTLYNMMKDQLNLTSEADRIASEKFLIARERYLIGSLSITDLSIAFQEKDQARRDYISALRDFWGAYFELRYLSLYDFALNRKITY
ncbi:TolC family protein [Arcticibacter sp. MXS-1]|uniref:TolC family protein n=1 Tax=Arcticibacter sp. MXS-1 TaxID=3341726 RepID=UPI0035A85B1B